MAPFRTKLGHHLYSNPAPPHYVAWILSSSPFPKSIPSVAKGLAYHIVNTSLLQTTARSIALKTQLGINNLDTDGET